MATIIIRNSTGSGAVPSSLVQGELAINTVDGKLFYGSGSGNDVIEFAGSPFPFTGSAGISGSLDINGPLTASNATISGNVTVLGTASINTLVVNQIGYSSGSNQLGDAANDIQTLYGSVIIPTGSLTVTGSTIISSSAATQLQVGSNLLFISSSGNVGINTSTPTYKLDINGTARIVSGLTSTGTNYLGKNYLALNTTLDSTGDPNIHKFNNDLILNAGASPQNIYMYTSGSTRMFISSSGNIGIGTLTPSYNLDVNGDIRSTRVYTNIIRDSNANAYINNTVTNASTTDISIGNTTAASTTFTAKTGGKFVFVTGSVGINTTTPTAQLQIKGTGAAGGTTVLRVENVNTSASLVVLDNGNVGIGITNPAYALQVSRSIWIQPTNNSDDGLYISNQGFLVFRDTANAITTRLRGIAGSYQFQDASYNIKSLISTNNNITYFNNGGGNVGIGITSPAATLHISGTSNSGLLEIDSPSSSNIIYVSGSGNVGIGTSTPISRFTIQTSGSVQAAQPIISAVSGSTFAGWLIYTGSSERARYAWSTGDGAYVYTTTTDPFTVFTNNTRALRIDSSQNVGIGTSADTPSARLQVRGSGATSATTAFIVQNSTPTNIITVLNNGTVGINRTPTASLDVAGTTRLSGSFNTAASGSILTVIGSGSTQPIFTVQGSQGELFSITDSLSGSLFSVNDISGLPILEVFSDNTTLIGDYQDPMLITTKKVTMTNSGSFVVYSLPTASYDTAFFDYSIKSGSNARAGQIMAIQSGSSVNFTETTTTDFGSTTSVSFTVIVSGSNMVLTGSAATGSWTIKTIVRGI